MKLSKIFSKPIEIKGGGVLNLRGFRKLIIDKEIGESSKFDFFNGLFTKFNSIFPLTNKIITDNNICDISDILNDNYHEFLFKKSDFNNLSNTDTVVYGCTTDLSSFSFNQDNKVNLTINNEYIIDNDAYITLVNTV